MVPEVRPVSARDTVVSVPPDSGDSAAPTDVDPLRSEAVPYSNETAAVPVPRFAFTTPVRVAVVVPINVAGEFVTAVGGARYVKAPFTVPPEPVSTTVTSPAACAGVTTVIDVALELTIDVPAVPSNVTAVVPVKLVPVIVTFVPPEVEPVAGDTDVIVGGSTYV